MTAPLHIIGQEWADRLSPSSAATDQRPLPGPCPICGHPTYDCSPEYVEAARLIAQAYDPGGHY